ncbi:MAG: Eco57I restriction-modification methylase domain-containing protein [Butyricicoccus sp.]|nr:Eco57I restriction-modification methylase domain-containing protein [Butyricicoccus sp.]
MVIDIQDELLRIHKLGLLDKLLADRTTKKNIIWATDAYRSLGAGYERGGEITTEQIAASDSGVIKARARKAAEQQSERTRRHAEVFTPLWICRKMNDHADKVWFGSEGVFFREGRPTPAVVFPHGRSWKEYVDSRRLELTCGEAPYLVTRYDVETGEMLPVPERVGLLDRKLRVVSENAQSEEEWLEWAFRAFRAAYGYELQGDNLLIARVNLLMTFEEYLRESWGREPSSEERQKLVSIITWNIWQMDGLTGTVPGEGGALPRCPVRDWNGGSFEFSALPTGRKFDFVIGNPPYQNVAVGEQRTYARPIYHQLIDASYKVADRAELIHPARFLFDAGSTPKAWNRRMLSDPHLKVLYYERDAGRIFNNTEIKGGVAITYHDDSMDFGPIGTFTAYPELDSILQKVRQRQDFSSFSSIVITRTAYRLTDKLHADYPQAIHQLSEGHAYDMSTNIFQRLPLVFFGDKPRDGHEYVQILGREGVERVYKYIREDYVNRVANLYKYKIYLSKANGAGELGEALSPPVLAGPGVAATETFLGIGAFDNLDEAQAALKYIKTKFARIMLGVLKTTQDITPQKWEHVPLQDFTSNSDIDWTKPISEIDRCLYKKYGLSEQEADFVERHGKKIE